MSSITIISFDLIKLSHLDTICINHSRKLTLGSQSQTKKKSHDTSLRKNQGVGTLINKVSASYSDKAMK